MWKLYKDSHESQKLKILRNLLEKSQKSDAIALAAVVKPVVAPAVEPVVEAAVALLVGESVRKKTCLLNRITYGRFLAFWIFDSKIDI